MMHFRLSSPLLVGSVAVAALACASVFVAAAPPAAKSNKAANSAAPSKKQDAAAKSASSDDAAPAADTVPNADWPQFRGPDGQGHASGRLPLRWTEKKNIKWKTPIPGAGWSSPAIQNGQLWLTTAVVKKKSLRALCLDVETGDIAHDIEVFHRDPLPNIHPKNSHATPTPIIVGDRVYVHFGAEGTAALTTSGAILWKKELAYYQHHGPGSSPVVVGDSLIIPCDGYLRPFYDNPTIAGITDHQFVVALDRNTGDVRWKSPRVGAHSYATPLAIEVAGKTQVVSPGGNGVTAYDPESGDAIWTCRYEGYSVVPRPVYGHGLVFVCTGYDVPSVLAIRVDGTGDVTDTHVEWTLKQGAPLNASPVLVGDELYMVSDLGIATCVDARTGKLRWKRRIGGNYSTSPLASDGRLYFLDESGVTHVLAADKKYESLATNRLKGTTLASLAAAGGRLYLRTDEALYCIEESEPEASKK
ncbi:MAG TPA: PQQ-binding-like beta-propeller repeat protein [Planctomycetaceae bacterium]|nr:PQQ-binding-like beta-propeller repeat protein [Planctomycetaceae bacterium]